MKKLVLTMSDGTQFSLSSHNNPEVRGISIQHGGPLKDDTDARLMLRKLAKDLAVVQVDQGAHIFVSNIITAAIADVDALVDSTAREQYPHSPCYCCGQLFVEATRRECGIGYHWRGLLADFSSVGVCPRCFNDYGLKCNMIEPWSEKEWDSWLRVRIDEAGTKADLQDLIARYEDHVGRVADEMIQKMTRLEEHSQAVASNTLSVQCSSCCQVFERRDTFLTEIGPVCGPCHLFIQQKA